MRLEDQVITLDQAIILRKLKIVQDSAFYHFPNANTDEYIKKWKLPSYHIFPASHNFPGKAAYKNLRASMLEGSLLRTYAAFSTAELGAMLPEYITSKLNSGSDRRKKGSKWYCGMIQCHKRYPIADKDLEDFVAPTEAQARAMMLIHGIKKKLPGFKIEEINKRLLAK